MSEHLSKQEAEEALKQAQTRLDELEHAWPLTEVDIENCTKKLEERKEALDEIKKEVDERRTEIANLRNTLGTYQQMELVASGNDEDFTGCPHEWQREVIVFMRRQPGVQIHFSALMTLVEKKLPTDVFTKNRSAMLNLMGHLITKSKVAKGKNGNYSWAVFPKNWKTPAPVIPINLKATLDRCPIAEKFVEQIRSGKEFIQKDLEREFHQKCIEEELSFGTPDDFKNDAQFIERYVYERAQQVTGIISVYENDPVGRKGDEISSHLIISRMRQPPKAPWVIVPNPTFKMPPLGIKRPGAKGA